MAKAYTRKDSKLVWITFSHNKKRYRRKTKYAATKKNLDLVTKEVLPILMHKIKIGEIQLELVVEKNFEYYSNLFMKTKKSLKPTSQKKYEKEALFWSDLFKDTEVNKIKASEIKKILFEKDIKVCTMRGYLCTIRQILDEALLDEVIASNPAFKVKLGRNVKTEIFPYDKDEVQTLLSNANDFFKCYIAIAFYTGVRTGELLAMKWQNVDFENKRIWIDATVGNYVEGLPKTGKKRYVPIFSSLVPFLKDQQKRTGLNNYIFSTKSGKPYGSSNLDQWFWKPLHRKSKVRLRRMYETRHTFATNMLTSQKFSLNQIASWLGHSNIHTLINDYNKFIPSEIASFDDEFDVFVTEKVTEKKESAI